MPECLGWAQEIPSRLEGNTGVKCCLNHAFEVEPCSGALRCALLLQQLGKTLWAGRSGGFCFAETGPTKHRSALAWLEWNDSWGSAFSACDSRLVSSDYPTAPLLFALPTMLRNVRESLFLEELLFSSRKDEHHATTYTPHISVNKAHVSPSHSSREHGNPCRSFLKQ